MKIRIKRDMLEQARQAVSTAKEQCNDIDARRDALPEVDAKMDGLKAVEKRDQEILEMDQQKAEIINQGKAQLTVLRLKAASALNKQVSLWGDHLENPDYALLRDGLIDSPEELEEVASRHDNMAFLKAVHNYAAERKWKGFGEPVYAAWSMTQVARGFLNTYFNLCDVAMTNLNGLASMQICDENELTRMAMAHGVLGMLE